MDFLTYNSVLAAIPEVWKKESILIPEPLNKSEGHNLSSANVSAKSALKIFVLKMFEPPNVERKLVKQNLSTKAVYELPFNIALENKVRCFQYKMAYITFY